MGVHLWLDRSVALAIAGALVAVLPAAPAQPAERAALAPQSTLVVASLQDVDTLNPFTGTSATSTQIFRLTYDYLTDYSPQDNHPVPALAQSWSTSADHLTWTFRLRGGVAWSDGVPLTAADVAFTYRTLMTHPTLANSALVTNFGSVSTPDPRTVVIRTTVPDPGMLALDIPIVPAHLWAGHDPATDLTGAAAVVGSGPFRLVEARPVAFYRFVRNTGYWRGAPKIDQLVFRYFSNADTAVQALKKGEADVLGGLTPGQFQALAGDPGIARNEARRSRLTELALNPGATRTNGTPIGAAHPALRDPRVRQAIDDVIDRRTLVTRVLAGHGDVGVGYLPATAKPWGWQPGATPLRSFDLAAANRILDTAGYRRGADGGRRMPDGGRRLAFSLLVPNGRPHYQQSATYLKGWLAEIGIDVRLEVMSDSEKSARTAAGRYDMFLGGWIYDPDPDFLLSVQTCAARPVGLSPGTTDDFICDPVYDALYRRQSSQLSPAARAVTVQQMQQRMYEDAELLPLYYPAVLEAYRADRFSGFVRRPAGFGSIAGPWSYDVVTPVAQPPARHRTPVVVILSTLAGLLGLLGAALWWFRATQDSRE